jgi:small subunit ribosomal protein S2
LTKVIADAAADGLIARHSGNEAEAEPLAEWERELLEQGAATPAAEEAVVEAPAAEATAVAAEELKTEEKGA